ncbi:hypothetical protein [Micromonospora sp. NPDC005413]|uniref:hypothetical protein n=1 Tax=Micromonospora sp. NPDC005413 TaxID=3154563 RepID=UPI0033AC91B0
MGVPFDVTPRAPSGVQNAPGCTPCRTDGVGGFAVVDFGFGLTVVVFGSGAVVFAGAGFVAGFTVRVGVGAGSGGAIVALAEVSPTAGVGVVSPSTSRPMAGGVDELGADTGLVLSSNALPIPPPQQHRPSRAATPRPIFCFRLSLLTEHIVLSR